MPSISLYKIFFKCKAFFLFLTNLVKSFSYFFYVVKLTQDLKTLIGCAWFFIEVLFYVYVFAVLCFYEEWSDPEHFEMWYTNEWDKWNTLILGRLFFCQPIEGHGDSVILLLCMWLYVSCTQHIHTCLAWSSISCWSGTHKNMYCLWQWSSICWFGPLGRPWSPTCCVANWV